MLRFTTAMALAIALPLSGLAAEKTVDPKAPAATVVAASTGDALPVPAAEPAAPSQQPAPKRLVPRGSSDSAAGYRFTTPYAVPPQTLPFAFPTIPSVHF